MLRKIFFFLLSFTLLLSVFPNSATPTNAQDVSCTAVAYSLARLKDGQPLPADNTDEQINIIVTYDINAINQPVMLFLKHQDATDPNIIYNFSTRSNASFTPNNEPDPKDPGRGKINAVGIYKDRDYYSIGFGATHDSTFKAGDYNVSVAPAEGSPENPFCTTRFNVASSELTGEGDDNYCNIRFTPGSDYTPPGTGVSFTVDFSPFGEPAFTEPADNLHRFILTNNRGLRLINDDLKYRTDEMVFPGVAIPGQLVGQRNGQLDVGTYQVEVKQHYVDYNVLGGGLGEGKSCFSLPFLIQTQDKGGGHVCTPENSSGCDLSGLFKNQPLSLPCSNIEGPNYSKEKGCLKIHTALGDINTQANDFVRWVLGFVLGISGGIVLIIIIISGYRLMTSQGDPEKVKNARDQLTAAVVGLLFIIFSLVILQLITQDILQIPGFGQP